MFDPRSIARARGGGSGPLGLVRRLVVLAFAAIQLVLVARILLDLGVLPSDLPMADALVPLSDALAAPVRGIGTGPGGLFGGGIPGAGAVAGGGIDPSIVAALVGWSVVEGLVLMVVRKLAVV